MKLSDVSPLAAMLTGQGAMGKAMAQGFGGMIPAAIARDARAAAEAEEAARKSGVGSVGSVAGQGQPMKKGGAVKAKGWGKARSARAAKVY